MAHIELDCENVHGHRNDPQSAHQGSSDVLDEAKPEWLVNPLPIAKGPQIVSRKHTDEGDGCGYEGSNQQPNIAVFEEEDRGAGLFCGQEREEGGIVHEDQDGLVDHIANAAYNGEPDDGDLRKPPPERP